MPWASSSRSITSSSSSSRSVIRRSSDSSSCCIRSRSLGLLISPWSIRSRSRCAAGLDLLDVGVDLLLLLGEVVDDDLGVALVALPLQPGLAQLSDLGELGQRGALVTQQVGTRVDLLDVEQIELGGGSAFSVGSSGRACQVESGGAGVGVTGGSSTGR